MFCFNFVSTMVLIPRVILTVFSKTSSKNVTALRSAAIPSIRFVSTEVSTAEPVEQDYVDEEQLAAAALEAKRNKSRLNSKHYKLLHGEIHVDPQNPYYPYEATVKFRQRLFAHHGQKSMINPGIAWPTKDELQDMIEYEKVANPLTIQEIVEKKKKLSEAETAKLINRQKDIETKMKKLGSWMKELQDRNNKKEAAIRAAQEKKDRLIEEVRQHFGYVVSMKDPRFQEMLDLKEKEARKAEKESKKKAKFEKASVKAAALAEAAGQTTEKPE